MTGLEAFAAGAGPDVLTLVSSRAAAAVRRRFLFRRSVARRVGKAVGFGFPGRPYRRWLKSLTSAEFSQPAEEVSSALAISLDRVMIERSAPWSALPDHLSRALRLVEETFPAIAAELEDRDYRQLTEQWARVRSSRARERLLQWSGADAALSSADLSLALLRRSEARREVRLLAFDLGEADVSPHMERIHVPEVPSGELRVLIGDFGAGKSEMAEAWHRRSLLALQERPDAPVPAWMRARELANRPLEQALDEQAGTAWCRGRGVDLVLDGLDEADPATGHAVLDSARVLVRSFDNVRVLITARHGVVDPESDERLDAPLLNADEAESLVRIAGAQANATWNWSGDMRATVQRPFFALATGAMLTRQQAPRGEADLIRALVEDALQRGSERATVAAAGIFSVLKNLAIAATSTESNVHLPFNERQTALSSRLVAIGADGRLSFALPIFQHWFAAQAVLQGDVSPAMVVSDPANFSKWRWAAAVAAMSQQDVDALDDLISAWVSGNPGATGWILQQAFAGSTWRQPEDSALDLAASGQRLLRAVRVWRDALGQWASSVLPALVATGPLTLGVAVNGRRITVALSLDTATDDTVTELPEGLSPFQAEPTAGWSVWYWGSAPRGPAWPWLIVRDLIANAALRSLAESPYLGGFDSVWDEERRYAMALELTGRSSLLRQPIPTVDIRRRVGELLGWINPDGYALMNSDRFAGVELDALLRWTYKTGATELPCPLPAPDAVGERSSWIWDMYSEEGLKRFEVEVYARACVAYDEALAEAFSTFGWSMPMSALQPMGVILGLHYFDGFGGRSPGLTVVRVPMALIREVAPTGPDVVWSVTGRAVIRRELDGSQGSWHRHQPTLERVRSWLAENNGQPPSSLSWSTTMADDMRNSRPSVAIAADWLGHDLKSLGLASGTLPYSW